MREIATSDIDEERRNQGKMSKEAKDRDVEPMCQSLNLEGKKIFFPQTEKNS